MISTTTEYALRALVEMARLPQKESVLARDLAASTHVPANYLSKVLLALRNAGLLDSARGAGGGYRLSRPADEILLVDVVEIFEPSKANPKCLLHDRPCSDDTPCAAHSAWHHLTKAYKGFLLSTSVASIAGLRPAQLRVQIGAHCAD